MGEKMQKRPSRRSLLVFEGVTLGGGALTGILTGRHMDFYHALTRPAFAPPGWLFPVAWTMLYALMAWAAWLVYRERKPMRLTALTVYFLQLLVNLAWPWLFFVMQALGLSFLWLLLLWALIITLMSLFFRQRRLAAWLLTPYLAWVTFAGVLNFTLALMNP